MASNAFQAFSNTVKNHTSISFETAQLIESYFLCFLPKNNIYSNCYVNVMNNHIVDSSKDQNIYIRKEHGFSHISVLSWNNTGTSFRQFNEREYYYIIRAYHDDNRSDKTIFQVRHDLQFRWGEKSVNGIHLMILDVPNRKVFVIDDPRSLLHMNAKLCQAENYDFLNEYEIPDNDLGWDYVSEYCEDKITNILMAEWQYLGLINYNKYESKTNVKVISYKNGIKGNTVIFKSIKQAYDILTGKGFKLSYKTFQRKCNGESPSLIKLENISFYVTTKLDFEGPENI